MQSCTAFIRLWLLNSGYGCSAVEIALMWVGRWRPTSAIVLVYSSMGMDSKGTNKEYQGIINRDFINVSPLSEKQLSGLSSLQKYASQLESDISQQVAVIQVSVLYFLYCSLRLYNSFIYPYHTFMCTEAQNEL